MTKTEEQALIAQHEARIRFLALSFNRMGVPLDDLLQEARIAFVIAVRHWRPDGGASLITFAHRSIVNALISLTRKAMTDIPVTHDGSTEVLDGALSAEELVVLVELLARLTIRERVVVLEHLASSKTYDELVAELGVSFKTVRWAHESALAKMRAVAEVAPLATLQRKTEAA